MSEGAPYVHVLGATRRPAFTVRRLLPAWEPPWPPLKGPALADRPCAACAFRQPSRILPIDFPLPPFDFDLTEPPRSPWQFDYLGAWPFPPARPSGII